MYKKYYSIGSLRTKRIKIEPVCCHEETVEASLFEQIFARVGKSSNLSFGLLASQNELDFGLGAVREHRPGLHDDLV